VIRPRIRRSLAVLIGALLVAAVALAVVGLRPRNEPAILQDRVRAVASTLRCPVCQDLSVADSPSGLAGQMRGQIATELRAGMTPEQVKAGFVRAYGDWILLSPPRHGINLLIWVVPALMLLAGLALVVAVVRRWTFGASAEASGEGPEGAISPADRRLLRRALAAEEEPE
jgi:cytochrome c-type biogenesis protein CcmH